MKCATQWGNTATRLRRRAIKNYWRTKADNLIENCKSLHNAFSPFMNSKNKSDQDIILKVEDNNVQEQRQVAEILTEYFSKIADNIGDIPNKSINNNITIDVLEQLLCQKLKKMSESILDMFMSAFRRKYSCETTLIS